MSKDMNTTEKLLADLKRDYAATKAERYAALMERKQIDSLTQRFEYNALSRDIAELSGEVTQLGSIISRLQLIVNEAAPQSFNDTIEWLTACE